MPNALHPADPLAPDIGSEQSGRTGSPQPHGFVTDIYAALEEQVLDVPQRKREAGSGTYIITARWMTSGDEWK